MTTDALGKEIQIGEKYSYSQHSNGTITIVRGTAEKIENGRVTLGEVEERWGVCGKIENDFEPQKRRRNVYAATLFPVMEEEKKLYRIPQIVGEVMRPCFMTEEKFEEGYRSSVFWTESNFMDAYRNHIVGMGHVAECAKIYIFKNWKKITDWTDLHLIVSHGPSGKVTEYFNYVPREKKDTPRNGSKIFEKVFQSMEEDDKKRHNPVITFDDVVLDPTDGDFSVTINGNEHWWIKDEAVIVLANFIEEKLKENGKINS
jgi:hypothetical protein